MMDYADKLDTMDDDCDIQGFPLEERIVQMKEDYLYPHEMFNISANGCYCGVFVPTHVMKKFMQISAKWSVEIQKLLNEYEDELLVADWTGVFPKDENGKIISSAIVNYSDKQDGWRTVKDRIKLFKPEQPKHVDVYLCNMDTAKQIAQEIYDESYAASKMNVETGE